MDTYNACSGRFEMTLLPVKLCAPGEMLRQVALLVEQRLYLRFMAEKVRASIKRK